MDNKYVDRAKKIIDKILYITIATVNKNGEPWNSPVYSAFDENYNFYWASDQNGKHSKNISENENVFIVIYDSTAPEGTGEGVYIKAKTTVLTDNKEILHGLEVLDKRVGKTKERNENEFLDEYPRRVYKATPEKVWVNDEGDVNGNYIDIRIEINLEDLKVPGR